MVRSTQQHRIIMNDASIKLSCSCHPFCHNLLLQCYYVMLYVCYRVLSSILICELSWGWLVVLVVWSCHTWVFVITRLSTWRSEPCLRSVLSNCADLTLCSQQWAYITYCAYDIVVSTYIRLDILKERNIRPKQRCRIKFSHEFIVFFSDKNNRSLHRQHHKTMT